MCAQTLHPPYIEYTYLKPFFQYVHQFVSPMLTVAYMLGTTGLWYNFYKVKYASEVYYITPAPLLSSLYGVGFPAKISLYFTFRS